VPTSHKDVSKKAEETASSNKGLEAKLIQHGHHHIQTIRRDRSDDHASSSNDKNTSTKVKAKCLL
jgi:hypothetical protein